MAAYLHDGCVMKCAKRVHSLQVVAGAEVDSVCVCGERRLWGKRFLPGLCLWQSCRQEA